MSVFSLPPTSKRLNDRQRVELDRAFQQQQLSDQEQQKLLRDNKEQHALHDRHVVQTQQQRDARRAEAEKAQALQKDPEGLGSLIHRAASSGEAKQLKKLLDRLAKEKPTQRRQIQQ